MPDYLAWPILNAGLALVIGIFIHGLVIRRWLPRMLNIDGNPLGYRYSRKIGPPLMLAVVLLALRLLLDAFPAWRERFDIYFVIAFVYLGAIVAIESVRYLLVEYLLEHRYGVSVPVLTVDIAGVVVYFLIAVVVLSVAFRVAVLPLLTTSTVLSIVLGLALQDTLGNLFAGIALQLDRPFRLGDWIEFIGSDGQRQAGRVIEITWRSTILTSISDERIILPNKTMGALTIYNYSHPGAKVLRYQYLHLPRTVAPTRAKEAILEVVRHVPGVLPHPDPLVDIRDYEAGLVKYIIIYWIDDFGRRLTIQGHIFEQLWYQFRRQGIEIPVPPRQVELVRRAKAEGGPPPEPTAERLQAVRQVDFLSVLADPDLAYVAEHMEPVLYGAGEILFEQGARHPDFYIIRSGEVVISVIGEDGKPVVKGRLGPGGFFGELSLLTGAHKSASVSFASDTQLYVIRKAIFDHIFARNPDAPQQMSRVITGRGALNMAGQPFVSSLKLREEQAATPAEAEEPHNQLLQAVKAFFGLS